MKEFSQSAQKTVPLIYEVSLCNSCFLPRSRIILFESKEGAVLVKGRGKEILHSQRLPLLPLNLHFWPCSSKELVTGSVGTTLLSFQYSALCLLRFESSSISCNLCSRQFVFQASYLNSVPV